MLKPKYAPKQTINSATRQFTDREEFTATFLRAVHKNPGDHRVLVFYGVGGIGKTRLCKELRRVIQERFKGTLTAVVDFDVATHRQPSTALFVLRESLNNSVDGRIVFPTFDLAFAMYRKKQSPHVPLKPDDLPLLEQGGLVADILATCGDLPLVGLAPKIMNILHKGQRKYEQWVLAGREILTEMQELEAPQLLNCLPYYWATDLKRYLATREISGTPIIFLDTYEALWEGKKQAADLLQADEWVRELIVNLPQVLWVITGRESLQWVKEDSDWEPALEQHLVGGLDERDADRFLQSCSIDGVEIRRAIIEGSGGLPLYLDLSVDTYVQINSLRPPVAEDFARTPKGVFERFLRYIDDRELATLRLLSLPRYWNEQLLLELVSHFKTGYPVTEYHRILRFSFISELREGGAWVLHDVMRKSLAEDTKLKNPKVFEEGHRLIHGLYDAFLDKVDVRSIGSKVLEALGEAFYHLNEVAPDAEIIDWLKIRIKPFRSAGLWDSLIPLFEALHRKGGTLPSTRRTFVYITLGELYSIQGKYILAVGKFQQVIAYLSQLQQSCKGQEQLEIWSLLAEAYQGFAQLPSNSNEEAMSLYTKGKAYYECVVSIKGGSLKYCYAELLVRMGKKQVFLSRYEDAAKSYSQAMDLCQQVLATDAKQASIQRTLGLVQEKIGELEMEYFGNQEQAGSLYRQAVESFEIALQEPKAIDYVITLHDKAFATKRLAEYYVVKPDLEQAVRSFISAVGIYDEVLKLSPFYVDAHINKGHALVDLIRLFVDAGQYSKARQWLDVAKDNFAWLILHVPNLAAAHNRFGSLYRTIGDMCWSEGDGTAALQAYKQALSLHDQAVCVSSGTYIYGYKSKGETLCQIASLHLATGRRLEAELVIRKAVTLFDEILQRAPEAQYAKRGKEKALQLLEP